MECIVGLSGGRIGEAWGVMKAGGFELKAWWMNVVYYVWLDG